MNKRIAGLLTSTLLTAAIAFAAVESPVTEGLLIGLDGSNVTMDGGEVQYWNDQAALGGAQNFYQATLANRPALLTGFTMPNGSPHNILDFNGSDEFLDLSADSSMETNTITVFTVVHGDNLNDSSSGYYISTADSANDRRWTMGERGIPNNNWITLATSDSGAAKICDVTGANQEEWYITSMTLDGADTGDVVAQTVSENSYVLADTATDATSAVYTHVRTRLGASSYDSVLYKFDGQLAEVLIYNRVLSAQEKSDVEQYLKYKYFRTATVDPPVSDGLIIGLDGSDLMITGDNIKYLNDQIEAGGASDFYQGTESYRPLLVTNSIMPNGRSHNIIDFDGTNQYLSIGADSSLSTNTITSFVVVRGNAMEDGKTGYILASADSVVRWGTGERSTDNKWFLLSRSTSGTAYIPNLTGVIQDQWYIVSMSWSGATGSFSGRALSQDDVLATDSAANIFNVSATQTRTRLGCNADSSVNLPFDGQMAEVLIYNRALPADEVQSVEEYLQYKYFKNVPPLGTVILIQ